MQNSITMHVGLDVHKDSIEIGTADVGGGEVRHVGRVGGDLPALDAALARLQCPVAGMQVVYEAGPCGYGSTGTWLRAESRVRWWRRR